MAHDNRARFDALRSRLPSPALCQRTARLSPTCERKPTPTSPCIDQGLPVLKALGFHGAVNITLGLPIVRTSVDHGTALDLAGSGKADAGSLKAAIQAAIDLA